MEIEVLIAAMNLKNKNEHEEFLKRTNVKTRSLLINQVTRQDVIDEMKAANAGELFNEINGTNRLLSLEEKGLSKSRNRALDNAIGNIGIICDDDITYVDNYENIIKRAYEKYPDAAIIAFYIESQNPERPVRHIPEGPVDLKKSLSICSSCITLNINKIRESKLRFNEQFGAGSKYYMGEENIFLAKALEMGLKIYSVDEKIANIGQLESTWYGNFDKEYFHIRGAVYYELSNQYYKDLIYDFADRKRNLYEMNLTHDEAVEAMFAGVEEYRRGNEQD